MRKGHTGIILIVDKSGSMYGLEKDTIGSINKFIEDQKAIEGTAEFGIVQFNDVVDELNIINLKDAKNLTSETYVTSGCTALNDAIGKVVTEYGNILNNRHEEDKPENVIICVTTDGYENVSKEYTKEKIKEIIEHQQNVYNWKFLFFGANIDSFEEGQQRGFSGNLTSNWVPNSAGTKVAYGTACYTVSCLRGGAPIGSIDVAEIYNQQMNEINS